MLHQGLLTTPVWNIKAKVSSQFPCCSAFGGILHHCPLPPLGFQTPGPSGFLPPSLSIRLQAASPPPSHLYLLIFSLCSPCPDDLVQSQAAGIQTDSCGSQGTSLDESPELRLVYPAFCPIFLSLCTSNRHLKHHVPTKFLILSHLDLLFPPVLLITMKDTTTYSCWLLKPPILEGTLSFSL